MVLFSDDLVHREVSQKLGMEPESAGFVSIEAVSEGDFKARCFGDSYTLDLAADPVKDGVLATIMFGLKPR